MAADEIISPELIKFHKFVIQLQLNKHHENL